MGVEWSTGGAADSERSGQPQEKRELTSKTHRCNIFKGKRDPQTQTTAELRQKRTPADGTIRRIADISLSEQKV